MSSGGQRAQPDRQTSGASAEALAGKNVDKRKSWRWVDWLRPCELAMHLPWINRRRPYVALHVYHHGYELFGGRSREIKVVLLMWGRLFTDRREYPAKSWEICGRWSA